MKAYQLLHSSLRHARGNYAVCETDGKPIFTNPDFFDGVCKATKWDICGALQHCYIYVHAMTILNEIDRIVREIVDKQGNHIYSGGINEKGQGIFGGWVTFNDQASFADIVSLLQTVENQFNLPTKLNE